MAATNKETCDVLVLGAGITGIAAAVELKHLSPLSKVIVVEARDRIGGRLLNSSPSDLPCPPGPFDLGGAWLTGLEGNPLVPLVKELGIKLKSEKTPEAKAVFAGTAERSDDHDNTSDTERASTPSNKAADDALSENTAQEGDLEAFYLPTMSKFSDEEVEAANSTAAKLYSRIRTEFGAPDRSLADAIQLLREKARQQGEDIDDLSLYLVRSNTELNEGAPMSQMSSEKFEAVGEGEFGDDYELVEGGYAQLPIKWAAKEGVDVRLSEPVKKVAWKEGGDGGVELQTNAGKTYKAKAAIITAPFPVLSSPNLSFQPPLPASHLEALSKFTTGTLSKLIVIFPHRFWDPSSHGIALVTKADERLEIPDHWLACTQLGLSNTGGDGEALLAFCMGSVAERMERETDKVVAESVEVFRKLYGKDRVPEPTAFLGTRWLSDPYSLGAYSFNGVTASDETSRAVKVPIGGRLWLAGEYTNDEGHRGYVHGGLIEGRRAAGEIVASRVLG